MNADSMVSQVVVVDGECEVEPTFPRRMRGKVRARVYECSFALSGGQASEMIEERSEIQTVITDLNVLGNLPLPRGVEAQRDRQVVAPAAIGRF